MCGLLPLECLFEVGKAIPVMSPGIDDIIEIISLMLQITPLQEGHKS